MQPALLEEKLRRALRGFYIGDAFGAGREDGAQVSARVSGIDAGSDAGIGATDTIADTIGTWTENGDIVAILASTVATNGVHWQPATIAAIRAWTVSGLAEIDKPPGNLSAVAKKVITNPGWHKDPAGTAKTATSSAPAHITNINLPVATSIAFLCSPAAAIIEWASMFAHDPLTGSVAIFYVNALRASVADNLPAYVDDMIKHAAGDQAAPVMLTFESIAELAYKPLTQLDLGTRPLYSMTTLRVICYALRIVHYARTCGRRPDLRRTLAHIASIAGSDASTNCAIAASIICAGTNPVGYEQLWLDIDNRLWITERIDGLVGVWFR